MAIPLTKCDKETNQPYQRPASIEAQIDEALTLDLKSLKPRLQVDRSSPQRLSSECLVHLLRYGLHRSNSGEDPLMNLALQELLKRCQLTLLAKIPDGSFREADYWREEILAQFAELLASDGTGELPNELDFFECRFNAAFRTFYIDRMRVARRHENRFVELPEPEEGEPGSYDDVFARVSEEFRVAAGQDGARLRTRLSEAILSLLTDDERTAVILVHVMGYKIEAIAGEESAATKCNCTGRTIRNRLKSAGAKLSRFKEEL